MDLIFNCPNCTQELEVDSSGAGQEIECPNCHEQNRNPDPETPGTAAAPEDGPAAQLSPQTINPIASSAAAKVEMHLKVPVRATGTHEQLIAKPLAPLEVAAKESDRQLKIKCIRRAECHEVGHDNFDDTVSQFLGRIGEKAVVSISPITYSHIDVGSQKLLNDYGVIIVYRG